MEAIAQRFFLRDHDGLYYVNWLINFEAMMAGSPPPGGWETPSNRIKQVKSKIESNMEKHRNNPRIYKHWHWAANYLNRGIDDMLSMYAKGMNDDDRKLFSKIIL